MHAHCAWTHNGRMNSDGPQLDALMTVLAVARLGTYSAAAVRLGVNHSTVSRRIAGLARVMGGHLLVRGVGGWETTELGKRAIRTAEEIERSVIELTAVDREDAVTGTIRIAAPEVFTSTVVIPAAHELRTRHPFLSIELLVATRPVRQSRSGVDLEIVVGRPDVNRAFATPIARYSLRLYATAEYLAAAGRPQTIADLSAHPLLYYIDSVLQVDELDRAIHQLPGQNPTIRSTSVFAHLAATATGAGIGILPEFLAATDPRLVPVLKADYQFPISYWAVVRDEGARNAVIAEALEILKLHGSRTRDTAAPYVS